MKRLLLALLTALMLNLAWAGPEEDAEMVKGLRLDAQKGGMTSQYFMGVIYRKGRAGVLQDYAEAVKWFRLAAQQGEPLSQQALGDMYSNGQGLVQDYVKAHSWFNLAAANGDPRAGKNRDTIANRMTPQQVAEAQKLARDCQVRQFKGCN